MGEALLRGFISSGTSSPGRISCSVNTLERRQLLEGLGVGNVFDDAEQGGARGIAECRDIIVLAVREWWGLQWWGCMHCVGVEGDGAGVVCGWARGLDLVACTKGLIVVGDWGGSWGQLNTRTQPPIHLPTQKSKTPKNTPKLRVF